MKQKLMLHWHCYQILKERKRLNRLVEQGHALSSKKLVGIGNKITSHCLKAGLFNVSQSNY